MKPAPKGRARYPKQTDNSEETLLVNETYKALDGEGPWQGFPVVIVRLMGCNLRCSYCDSKFAYYEGERTTLSALVKKISSYRIKKVLVTGGEPLAQRGTPFLLEKLLKLKFEVSLETNGSYPIEPVPEGVVKIVDVKTPGSGSGEFFAEGNLRLLGKGDCLKLVICSRGDYEWSKKFLAKHKKICCDIVFSPAWSEVSPPELAGWMLDDGLDVRFAVQLHKILWGDVRGV
ncbi:MAG TPA: radical SAM protein [Acidobacteriota bacterium]|jgi:7-carboxy-7-deazaguanine synthase|nr:radical SAM protein [Acidobacteriota bacterium]HNT18097.1 radical SAM protein [Acidobacteriota bacterium]HPA27216.1 radical SAM protein [Acidobacteriota bacterium]HQO19434.1 radical SAM protein [Acidobacteriota bacterium]HQQ46128.1 radical SAM protein [Acidobacteriota bacterium]